MQTVSNKPYMMRGALAGSSLFGGRALLKDIDYTSASVVCTKWADSRSPRRAVTVTLILAVVAAVFGFWILHVALSPRKIDYFKEPVRLRTELSVNCADRLPATPTRRPPANLPSDASQAVVEADTKLLKALIEDKQKWEELQGLTVNCLATDTAEMRAQLENLNARAQLIDALKRRNPKIPAWLYEFQERALFQRWVWVALAGFCLSLLAIPFCIGFYLWYPQPSRPMPDPRIAADIFESGPQKWNLFPVHERFITDDVLFSLLTDDRLENLLAQRHGEGATFIAEEPAFRYILYSIVKKQRAMALWIYKGWAEAKRLMPKHGDKEATPSKERGGVPWSIVAGAFAAVLLICGQVMLAHRVEDVKTKQEETKTEIREKLIPSPCASTNCKSDPPPPAKSESSKEVKESSVSSTTVKDHLIERTLVHDVPHLSGIAPTAETHAASANPTATSAVNVNLEAPEKQEKDTKRRCATPGNEVLLFFTPNQPRETILWDGKPIKFTLVRKNDTGWPPLRVRLKTSDGVDFQVEKQEMYIAPLDAYAWIDRVSKHIVLIGRPKDALIVHLQRRSEVYFAEKCEGSQTASTTPPASNAPAPRNSRTPADPSTPPSRP